MDKPSETEPLHDEPIIAELVKRQALTESQADGAAIEFQPRNLLQRLRRIQPWHVVDKTGSPLGITGTLPLAMIRNNLDYLEVTDDGKVLVFINW